MIQDGLQIVWLLLPWECSGTCLFATRAISERLEVCSGDSSRLCERL